MGIFEKVKAKAASSYSSYKANKAEEKAAWDIAYSEQRDTLKGIQREQKLTSVGEKARARAEWRYNAGGRLGGMLRGGMNALQSNMKAARAKNMGRAKSQPSMGLAIGGGSSVDYGFGSIGKGGMGLGKMGKMNVGLGPSSLKFGNKRKMRII